MEITLEWEGISGIIKMTLFFSVIFISGFVFGRKTK